MATIKDSEFLRVLTIHFNRLLEVSTLENFPHVNYELAFIPKVTELRTGLNLRPLSLLKKIDVILFRLVYTRLTSSIS